MLVRSSSSSTVHCRPAKNCLSARICRRYRSGLPARSRSSESESNTTRVGLIRSTSARIVLVVSLSSTSDGWNIVYCSSGRRLSSLGTSSRIVIPSSDQPWESATLAELLFGFRERHVQDRLAAPGTFQQELQRERGLAGARHAFDQVQPMRREAPAENVVEALDAGLERR